MEEPASIPIAATKKDSNALVFWPRSLKHQLEGTGNLCDTNSWSKVDKPVKGGGATNYVDYSMIPSVRFFRLVHSD